MRSILFTTALTLVLIGSLAGAAEPPADWPQVRLPNAREVELSGALGEALRRGVARIGQAPFTEAWLVADVSFEVQRIFTNYSGDASGRFIELAALTSPPGRRVPAALNPVLAAIPRYQKPDGHFGVPVDLAKPLAKGSAPIPMLWGNARLLVGLVTCAQQFHDPKLLDAAKRLGNFYVTTADQLCAASREADYRSSGTYGDSYTCCYFPAIEGLAMLYQTTKDDRYLATARRIAEFFRKFDALPTDHSHGNLCAWRGILQLHEITGDRKYVDLARAKWEAAMAGGYVWPVGGIGEHWFVWFHGDEGCSESDWLRFNLDLWRFTGDGRYLDVAERLLANQYPANQCPNGGYGMRHFDGDPAGPIATHGVVEEWPFCCSFHGPLGLQFLKAYLAAGSDRGVFVNFPLDFRASVQASGRTWRLAVRNEPQYREGTAMTEIELAPQDPTGPVRTTLWLRMPGWATTAKATVGSNNAIRAPIERGYLRIDREFRSGEPLRVVFQTGLSAEGRRFRKVRPEARKIARLREVTLLSGPEVLFAAPVPGAGRPTLLATVDSVGRLGLPAGGRATASLPGIEATEAQVGEALASARSVLLEPWSSRASTKRRAAFVFDLVVMPQSSLPEKALAHFAERAKTAAGLAAPVFGENLERRPEIWLSSAGWKFTPEGLHVTGGDVGLIDGEGYGDYRFEFDLVLPKEGEGITGWVVRAQSESDCVMFQLQSADSPYRAPQFKTRPNTLRPHTRRNGQWTVLDPVNLPKEIRRGESHHVAVECRGDRVEVSLDGQKAFGHIAPEWRTGGVGFRAAGPGEQGLFQKISVRKLQ